MIWCQAEHHVIGGLQSTCDWFCCGGATHLNDVEGAAANVGARLLRVLKRQQLCALLLPPGLQLAHNAALYHKDVHHMTCNRP